MTGGHVLLLSFVFAVMAFVIVAFFGMPLIFPFVAALGAACLPYLHLLRKKKKRMHAFEAQFADAVDLLGRAIRAGHAFTTGLQMIGEEVPDPVGEEFRRCFEEQKFGLPLKDSLLNLIERVDLLDLRIFVTAVLIQRIGAHRRDMDRSPTDREVSRSGGRCGLHGAGRMKGTCWGPPIARHDHLAMNQVHEDLFERQIARAIARRRHAGQGF